MTKEIQCHTPVRIAGNFFSEVDNFYKQCAHCDTGPIIIMGAEPITIDPTAAKRQTPRTFCVSETVTTICGDFYVYTSSFLCSNN